MHLRNFKAHSPSQSKGPFPEIQDFFQGGGWQKTPATLIILVDNALGKDLEFYEEPLRVSRDLGAGAGLKFCHGFTDAGIPAMGPQK